MRALMAVALILLLLTGCGGGGGERERDGAGVREHVRRVGEQRQRIGDDARPDLDEHEAEDQPEREPELAAIGVGRDGVVVAVVAVVVGHGN